MRAAWNTIEGTNKVSCAWVQNMKVTFIFSCVLGFLKLFHSPLGFHRASLVVQMLKKLTAVQDAQVQSLGQEDPLEE